MAVQLQQLRARVRERADLENSQFVTTDELDVYINQSVSELYDLLVASYGSDYFLAEYAFSTVIGQEDYALPYNFYRLRGLDLTVNGINYTIERFMFRERNRWQSASPVLVYNSNIPNIRYRIVGTNIRLQPEPAAVYAFTLHYVPTAMRLISTTDTIESEIVDGWSEYIVLDAAIKCLNKEESDTTGLSARLERMRERIMSMAERDEGEPERVVDVHDLQGDHWGRLR